MADFPDQTGPSKLLQLKQMADCPGSTGPSTFLQLQQMAGCFDSAGVSKLQRDDDHQESNLVSVEFQVFGEVQVCRL